MKEGQEKIYYVTAETFLAAKNSPHLEIFRKRGVEVLLLSERVDEWLVGNLTEFEGKKLGVGRARRPRPGQDPGRGRKEGAGSAGDAGGRAQGAAGKAEGSPRRQGEGGARVDAPHRVAVLPGGGRARHGRQPRAHPQGGGPEGAAGGADPRNQPGPRHRRSACTPAIRRWRTGRACCSTRPCSPKAASWRTRRGSSGAATRCCSRSRRSSGAATMAAHERTADRGDFLRLRLTLVLSQYRAYREAETGAQREGEMGAFPAAPGYAAEGPQPGGPVCAGAATTFRRCRRRCARAWRPRACPTAIAA